MLQQQSVPDEREQSLRFSQLQFLQVQFLQLQLGFLQVIIELYNSFILNYNIYFVDHYN